MVSRLPYTTIRHLKLAFATAPRLGRLALLCMVTRRFIMQKARRHPEGAPTACRHTVSGTISIRYERFFSPFPHGTCSLSVSEKYLALGDGPPGFIQDCTCPALLRYSLRFTQLRLPDYHRLWWTFPRHFSSRHSCDVESPTTPAMPCDTAGLGSSPFDRLY